MWLCTSIRPSKHKGESCVCSYSLYRKSLFWLAIKILGTLSSSLFGSFISSWQMDLIDPDVSPSHCDDLVNLKDNFQTTTNWFNVMIYLHVNILSAFVQYNYVSLHFKDTLVCLWISVMWCNCGPLYLYLQLRVEFPRSSMCQHLSLYIITRHYYRFSSHLLAFFSSFVFHH